MTKFLLDDPLLDSQLLRVAGAEAAGGGSRDECLVIGRNLAGTDLDQWHRAWTEAADRVVAEGEAAQASGEPGLARAAFFRAANYQRSAGVMLMGIPLDPRLVETHRRQTELFRRAAALLERPPEIVEIPFAGSRLVGYFFRASDAPGRRATAILLGGYDGTAEELYFFNGAAALERGYHVLAFDGPGQGQALLEDGQPIRPDYETVIGAVVDHLETRSEVDPARIALIGLSLGAHLGPRAVSVERRIAACIADCGSFDLHDAFVGRLPGFLARPFDRGNRLARFVVRVILGRLLRSPTGGWALRRGLLVHGVGDPLRYVDSLREYSLRGRASSITCPTWICNAEGDDVSASAPELAATMPGVATFMTFTAADGADDHCEVGNRELYHQRSFGWLDGLLAPATVA